MNIYLSIFCVAFISGYVVLNILKAVSSKLPVFKNKGNISILGGIGLLLSFMLGLLYFSSYGDIPLSFELIHILVFSLIIFVVGLFDDFNEFSLFKKIFVQVVVVGVFLIHGKPIQICFIPLWSNYLISFLWIIGITNIFNLLDIGDGFCAGVSLIVGMAFFTVLFINGNFLTAGLFAGLCGTLFSFLILNFPPAKIILGNSGSHLLGFLFAALSIHGDYATLNNPFSVLIPLVILAFPLIDTFYLIVVRLKKGLMPLRKSDDHIFLHLLSSGKKIKPALFNIYLVTFLWGVSGVFLIFGINIIFSVFVFLAVLFSIRLVFIAQRAG